MIDSTTEDVDQFSAALAAAWSPLEPVSIACDWDMKNGDLKQSENLCGFHF